MKKIIKVLLVIAILFISLPVFADTTITLDIETDTGSIYNQEITVTPCDNDNDPLTIETEITAYCALVQSGIASDWSGLWINSINSIINNDNGNGIYWMWLANLNIDNPYSDFTCHQDAPSGCSAKEYILNSNDKILFYYNINPLNISVDNLNPIVEDNIIISIKELGLDGWTSVWNPATGGKIIINSNTYDLDSNGTYSFLISDTTPLEIKGQKDGFIDTSLVNITPSPKPEPVHHHSSSGSYVNYVSTTIINDAPKTVFDTKKAFEFLLSQQKENGSFGEDIYTDWVTLALANDTLHQDQKNKLIKYLSENKLSGNNLTDYERKSMALMALGLNPYNLNNENPAMDGTSYIEKIVKNFDGTQFGDINQDNDDIFALIVLQNTGFTQDEEIIKDTINFIISKQKENGSWDESVDMTGASIEALANFKENEQVKNALIKAKEYLKQNQKDDGSWNNVSSTAWAMQGILALGEKVEDWKKNENTPIYYLALNQDIDGGIKNENLQNKIWQTSYVLASLSGKTWNQVMQKFEKQDFEAPETIPEINKIILQNKIETSNQAKFSKKISKFQKINTKKIEEAVKIDKNQINENIPEIPKKESWFRRFFKRIFSIF